MKKISLNRFRFSFVRHFGFIHKIPIKLLALRDASRDPTHRFLRWRNCSLMKILENKKDSCDRKEKKKENRQKEKFGGGTGKSRVRKTTIQIDLHWFDWPI